VISHACGSGMKTPERPQSIGPCGITLELTLHSTGCRLNRGQDHHLRRSTMDDRVCMHYVIDRLEDILEDVKLDTNKVLELKRELIYNLGINQRIIHEEEDA
jgi:hypothetical protein